MFDRTNVDHQAPRAASEVLRDDHGYRPCRSLSPSLFGLWDGGRSLTLTKWFDPDRYYAVKGAGRIVLLIGISIYGIGLLLKRADAERRQAGLTDDQDDDSMKGMFRDE